MSFLLCRLSWSFSALFISVMMIGSGASAQVAQKNQPINTSETKAQSWQAQSRDYATAINLGVAAADQCYQQKKIDECNNLQNIQNTLSTWCAENDQNGCEAYNTVVDYSMSVQSNEMQKDLVDQIEPGI